MPGVPEIARRFIGGRWQTGVAEDEGGGAQPENVRRLAFDLDFATDFLAGPITLYTPDAGETAGPVYLAAVTFADNNAVVIGRDETDPSDNEFPPLATVSADEARDSFTVSQGSALFVTPTTTGPVTAGYADTAAGNANAYPWQANHGYDGTYGAAVSGQMIVMVGHIWVADTGGTSGGSEPDFAGNIGGTVADNDLVWTDNGPAQGSVTVLLDVRAAS